MLEIKDNIACIEQQILHACQQNNRNRDEIRILAVSKTKPAALIEQAYKAGLREFGENYLQEAIGKIKQLNQLTDLKWHFIGPIQSNKTKTIAENFSWVQSVDRLKIIQRLNDHRRQAIDEGIQQQPLNVCLQVNISGEANKSGACVEQLNNLAQAVMHSPYLQLRGLMAIPEKSAPFIRYQQMQTLFNSLKAQYSKVDTLSLGMSNDLALAIGAGSTMVRIGTAIFGARTP
jgi:hypothetical protein